MTDSQLILKEVRKEFSKRDKLFNKRFDAVENKLTKVSEETTKTGVLLEHVQSEVHAVAEQHGSVIERLDAQGEMLGGMAEDLTQVRIDSEYTLRKLDRKADKSDIEELGKKLADHTASSVS
jgi:hypothetical protein